MAGRCAEKPDEQRRTFAKPAETGRTACAMRKNIGGRARPLAKPRENHGRCFCFFFAGNMIPSGDKGAYGSCCVPRRGAVCPAGVLCAPQGCRVPRRGAVAPPRILEGGKKESAFGAPRARHAIAAAPCRRVPCGRGTFGISARVQGGFSAQKSDVRKRPYGGGSAKEGSEKSRWAGFFTFRFLKKRKRPLKKENGAKERAGVPASLKGKPF